MPARVVVEKINASRDARVRIGYIASGIVVKRFAARQRGDSLFTGTQIRPYRVLKSEKNGLKSTDELHQ